MNGQRLLVLAGAAGAIAAAVVALGTSSSAPSGAAPEVRVLVSRSEIASGTALRSELVVGQRWEGGGAPPAGALDDMATIDGSVVRHDIPAGRVITANDLWQGGSDGALMPEPGHLAYSTRTGDIGRVVGFEGPGSKVDVLLSATRNVPQPFSRVVLRGIRVLAVAADTGGGKTDAKLESGADRSSRVTLELTPQQAERLDLSRHVGELTLVVRSADGPSDDGRETPGARIADLLGRGAQDLADPAQGRTSPMPTGAALPRERSAAPTKPKPIVEEIRGGQMTRREEPA